MSDSLLLSDKSCTDSSNNVEYFTLNQYVMCILFRQFQRSLGDYMRQFDNLS